MGENVMGGGGMTPADVAAVTGGNENGWGGGAWWIFALFAMMMVGGGNWWGNRGYQPQYATQDFVQNGFNFNDLQDQNRDLMQAITGGTAQSVAATNQSYHDMYTVIADKYGELQRDISNIALGQANSLAAQNECCCKTLRAIDGVNYNNAMSAADIKQAILMDGNATRQMIQEDKIERLRDRINTLELSNAMQGVVRYPDSYSYSAGPNPFCGCGNGFNM